MTQFMTNAARRLMYSMFSMCVFVLALAPSIADDGSRGKNRDSRGKDHCRSVPGTYISRNIETDSPDEPDTVSLRNRIVMIHDDGTIATYQSAQLDELDRGNELAPAMGNWVCVGRNAIKAVAFDYFANGTNIGGPPIGQQRWDEFDRITMQINVGRKYAIMKLRLIGIAKEDDADKLDPDVNPTVVTNIRTYKLERIGSIRKIVDADFTR